MDNAADKLREQRQAWIARYDLDRDGVINQDSDDFIKNPDEWIPIPGSLEAIARLKEMETPPFVLELVGDGAQRSLLEQMVIERDLSRHVVFAGWVGHPDLVAHYRRADLFVTATTWEGMPNTVLEAMACGLPVVGTAAPGMNQLVNDGVNGYLVPLRDAAALADRLRRLLADPLERARMGRESRKIAARHFAWDVIARQYVDIYRRVVDNKG